MNLPAKSPVVLGEFAIAGYLFLRFESL